MVFTTTINTIVNDNELPRINVEHFSTQYDR